MKIPISLKLKRKQHKDIAYAQDIIVEELYRFFPKAIIHGGTAIWRCYGGNRFSEDIDVYIEKDKEKIDSFFETVKKRGFVVIKKRIKENSLYSVLRFNTTIVRLEAIFKKLKNIVLKEYETSDGLFISVFTLNVEDLVKEKILAYMKREKIRDLYDIFFLLQHVKERSKVKKDLIELIKKSEKPEDEETLKTLVIMGAIPDLRKILEYIRRWVK